MTEPELVEIPERKLVGMHRRMSLAENTTKELWQTFMPRRKEIFNKANEWLYSVQVYDEPLTLHTFTPATVFERWAAVEVTDFQELPEGMESHLLSGGKYAIFIHKGPAHAFAKTFDYIFRTWLPNSGYEVDRRAHFEIMGDKYLGIDNPNSEEEIWIPIKESLIS